MSPAVFPDAVPGASAERSRAELKSQMMSLLREPQSADPLEAQQPAG